MYDEPQNGDQMAYRVWHSLEAAYASSLFPLELGAHPGKQNHDLHWPGERQP
jgi:hypothetical protein